MSNSMTLLVEDDVLQREFLSEILKDEGFDVIECATAEAAELIVASAGTELQALVTDNNLGGSMTGIALAQHARRKHPNMHVVIMSGNEIDARPTDTVFLRKPFASSALLEAVRD